MIEEREKEVEPPPILGSWRNLYLFVLGFLVVQIVIYYLMTRAFS